MFFFFCQKRATLGFENFFFAANVSNIKLSFVPWNEEIVCGISRAFDRDERV